MPAFAWNPRPFASVAAFSAYVASLGPAPRWAQGLTVHHTWSPDVDGWGGARSMAGLGRYYQYSVQNLDGSRGWPAEPHLFIAPDGVIWQGTPLTVPGVHAGAWNRVFWGMEVVGNYDVKPWSPITQAAAMGAAAVLFRWANIQTVSLATLRGHRECGSKKTCPGRQINMDVLRAALQTQLGPRLRTFTVAARPLDADATFGAIREGRGATFKVALDGTARLAPGAKILVDDVTDGWAHIAKASPVYGDVGFVPVAQLIEAV